MLIKMALEVVVNGKAPRGTYFRTTFRSYAKTPTQRCIGSLSDISEDYNVGVRLASTGHIPVSSLSEDPES